MAKIFVERSLDNIIKGRNGAALLTAFEIEYFKGSVFISGYGFRDKEINGGFIISSELAIRACKEFLEERGFEVTQTIL